MFQETKACDNLIDLPSLSENDLLESVEVCFYCILYEKLVSETFLFPFIVFTLFQ